MTTRYLIIDKTDATILGVADTLVGARRAARLHHASYRKAA